MKNEKNGHRKLRFFKRARSMGSMIVLRQAHHRPVRTLMPVLSSARASTRFLKSHCFAFKISYWCDDILYISADVVSRICWLTSQLLRFVSCNSMRDLRVSYRRRFHCGILHSRISACCTTIPAFPHIPCFSCHYSLTHNSRINNKLLVS